MMYLTNLIITLSIIMFTSVLTQLCSINKYVAAVYLIINHGYVLLFWKSYDEDWNVGRNCYPSILKKSLNNVVDKKFQFIFIFFWRKWTCLGANDYSVHSFGSFSSKYRTVSTTKDIFVISLPCLIPLNYSFLVFVWYYPSLVSN